MLDFIIELVLDLLFEGSYEISKNKKINKWIRYPFAIIVIMIFLAFIFAIILLGVLLFSENALIGSVIIGWGVYVFIMSTNKFRKVYIENSQKD